LVQNEQWDVLFDEDDVAETVARNQEIELLTEAIQSLPDRCRQVFTLRKVYGMSQPDIAKKLGISTHTVSAQLTIGVHKCTEFMARFRAEK
jgi:RNA polymerase sigma-70 factor (ECF subfamily)